LSETLFQPIEKTLEIEYRGQKLTIKIRELTASEYLKAQDKAIKKILPDGSVDLDRNSYLLELVSMSIVEAPFPTDVESLKKLPASLFNTILYKVLEINPLSS